MKVRMITEDEQRLLQRGLSKLGEQAADQLYGRLWRVDGKVLLLVDLEGTPPDQEETEDAAVIRGIRERAGRYMGATDT